MIGQSTDREIQHAHWVAFACILQRQKLCTMTKSILTILQVISVHSFFNKLKIQFGQPVPLIMYVIDCFEQASRLCCLPPTEAILVSVLISSRYYF